MTIDFGSLLHPECDEQKYLDRRWIGANNVLADLYAETEEEEDEVTIAPIVGNWVTIQASPVVLLGAGRPRQAPTAQRVNAGNAVVTWKMTKHFSQKLQDVGVQTEALSGAFAKLSHHLSNVASSFERVLLVYQDAASELNASLARLATGLSQIEGSQQGALTEFIKQRPRGALEEILSTLSASFGAQDEATTRVRQLEQLAREEGSLYNNNSATKLFEFLRSAPALKAPKIFLLDGGNLRAVWKGESGSQCALEFLGNDRVRYVLFFPRNGRVSRNAGNDTLQGVVKQIEAAELRELVGFA